MYLWDVRGLLSLLMVKLVFVSIDLAPKVDFIGEREPCTKWYAPFFDRNEDLALVPKNPLGAFDRNGPHSSHHNSASWGTFVNIERHHSNFLRVLLKDTYTNYFLLNRNDVALDCSSTQTLPLKDYEPSLVELEAQYNEARQNACAEGGGTWNRKFWTFWTENSMTPV